MLGSNGNIFSIRNSVRCPKLIAHRGHTGIAPENSLPSFLVAAQIGVWAIETDVWSTKDDILVCNHNVTTNEMYGEDGNIPEMTLSELSRFRLIKGNNLKNYDSDELRMPLFSEYLAICRKYGSVPFIEIKGEVTEQIINALRSYGMEEYAVISSIKFEHLKHARAISPSIFIHHIFSSEEYLPVLSEMGYSGMSFNITELKLVPKGLVEEVHFHGMRMCLRAGDTREQVVRMIEIGLDYIPTNCVYSL